MVTTVEYALMSGRAYQTTRDLINQFPIPDGWLEFRHVPNNSAYPQFTDADGFEATSFQSQCSNEIVISFAGTYPTSLGDWAANIGLATGSGSVQLQQAVDYYLSVKASAPAGATITLTGHSLGGGLAALVGVFFGVETHTFDQAPFANSAQDPSITASLNPLNWLFGAPDIAGNMKQYLQGKTFATGTPEDAARDSMVQKLDGFLTQRTGSSIPNSNLVTTIRVDGEFTSALGVGVFDPIGNPADILKHGPHIAPSIDLHYQDLLTAFLQSGDTSTSTAADHTLGQATIKLTDLLGMLFDPKLYLFDTDKPDPNFLEHLVRHQAGGVDGVQAGGDAMVTRFTADLWKLAQDGGMTMNEGVWAAYSNYTNVSKALIAFAMQFYYEENSPNVTYGTELFTDLSATNQGSNGIRFDITDTYAGTAATPSTPAIPGLLQQWQADDMKLDAKDASGKYLVKGYQYFQAYLDTTSTFTPQERAIIKSMLPQLRDWYVQAGNGGMLASDTLNRGALMLGGNSGDALTGGTKADLLVGNGGDDMLQSGQGSDMLVGGSGNDAYVYTTGDGLDTVLDSDGQGSIVIDGNIIAGGSQYGDTRVHRDTFGHTYTDVGQGLIIDGNIFVQNWQAGNGSEWRVAA